MCKIHTYYIYYIIKQLYGRNSNKEINSFIRSKK